MPFPDWISLRILALIPAFNEERSVGNIIRKTLQYADQVVVCDDGSHDNTSGIAESSGAFVIKHEKNLGKGAALKTLFKYARHSIADVIVTIDGDGQFLPEEIPKLVKPIEERQADVVIGYRFDDTKEMPSYRKAGNKFLDKVANVASEIPIRDTQSGFRAYSKDVIDTINFTSNGFGADAEIIILASQKGFRIIEEKVMVLYNTGRRTSTKNPVSHTSEVIVSLIEMIAFKRPLRLLGIPGFCILIVGIISSITVISYFNESRYFSIPLTLLSIGSLTLGTMLILMSVLLFSVSRLRQN